MFKYFENKKNAYKLTDTEKTAVSLSIDSVVIKKADILALKEERSRNFIINRWLSNIIQIMERDNGIINVDADVLKLIRRPKGGFNE